MAKILQFLQQTEHPSLNEVVEVRNKPAEIDVDLIIDQSFDVVNIQREQFEIISKFAQSSDIDILELLELSDLRGKDELIEKIERRRAQAAQDPAKLLEQQTEQAKGEQVAIKSQNIAADTVVKQIDAVTKQLENIILVENPDQSPQVSV